MNGSILETLAIRFAIISCVAVGGANAVTPDIHRLVVERFGWLTSTEFANLFAITQATPGPNVLLVSLIGWHMAGWAGLGVATLAMNVPSSVLAFAVGRAVRRWHARAWLRVLRTSLAPVAVGLLMASGLVLARAADDGVLDVALTVAGAASVVLTRINPVWVLFAAVGAALLAAAV